jgi:hypothetical protein
MLCVVVAVGGCKGKAKSWNLQQFIQKISQKLSFCRKLMILVNVL